MTRAVLLVGLSAAVLSMPGRAGAERFAVLAASNQGWATEPPLRFAERDARRLATTLIELGQFPRENVMVLPSATPTSIERSLAEIGQRVAASASKQHLLLLYYSGHADSQGLHPGRSRLTYARLKQLLAQVPAAVRVTLIDSCNSGTITRLKGRPGPAFDVRLSTSDRVEGDVFITSASAREGAQESDQLRGSFFTNYVTAGLRGAADVNRDGRVTLAEMYAYAYAMTVGSTSGTRAGTQHPAHRFDLRGKGEVVISFPARARACLLFAPQRETTRYLVLHESERVVAEVSSSSTKRIRLAVVPGQYTVRRRSAKGVFQQRLTLLAQECHQVQPQRMREVVLPDTLSKGELLAKTWSVSLGYTLSLGWPAEGGPIGHGATLALRVPLGSWALRPQLQFAQAAVSGDFLAGQRNIWGAGLAFTRDFATPWGLLALGALADYQLIRQRVDPLPQAWVSGLRAGALARWAVPLQLWRLGLGIETRGGYMVQGLGGEASSRAFVELGVGVITWW